MQNEMVKVAIENIHSNSANILIGPTHLTELTEDQIKILRGFHMEELYLIEADDNYFCNIRANHFCVEYGYSELVGTEGGRSKLILITANHKGSRVLTLLKMN